MVILTKEQIIILRNSVHGRIMYTTDASDADFRNLHVLAYNSFINFETEIGYRVTDSGMEYYDNLCAMLRVSEETLLKLRSDANEVLGRK